MGQGRNLFVPMHLAVILFFAVIALLYSHKTRSSYEPCNLWIIIALAVLALFIATGINTIPRLDEKVNASWAEVQNQYQRRMDLIPNLVETVKGLCQF